MKLIEYAKRCGVDWTTAKRWYRQGLIPGAYQPVKRGSIIVPDDIFERLGNNQTIDNNGITVTYATAIAGPDADKSLTEQTKRLMGYCNAKGWSVDRTIQETAGPAENASQLISMLTSGESIQRIVMTSPSSINHFAYPFMETIANEHNISLVFMTPPDNSSDEFKDEAKTVILWYLTKLYGNHQGKVKFNKMMELMP